MYTCIFPLSAFLFYTTLLKVADHKIINISVRDKNNKIIGCLSRTKKMKDSHPRNLQMIDCIKTSQGNHSLLSYPYCCCIFMSSHMKQCNDFICSLVNWRRLNNLSPLSIKIIISNCICQFADLLVIQKTRKVLTREQEIRKTRHDIVLANPSLRVACYCIL